MLPRPRYRPPARRENLHTLRDPAMVLGQPIISISCPAGPDTAAPPTMGLTAAIRRLCVPQSIANARHGENRSNAGDRITRRKNNRIRCLNALDHARRRGATVRRLQIARPAPRPDAARAQSIPEKSACPWPCRAWSKPARPTWAARARECRASSPVRPSLRSDVLPARSSAVRVRCVARSRSPRLNHAG